jgi:hypothetical protein
MAVVRSAQTPRSGPARLQDRSGEALPPLAVTDSSVAVYTHREARPNEQSLAKGDNAAAMLILMAAMAVAIRDVHPLRVVDVVGRSNAPCPLSGPAIASRVRVAVGGLVLDVAVLVAGSVLGRRRTRA